MKKVSFGAALTAITGLLLVAPAAHAYDGQIEFTGSLVGTTCTINGGENNFTVAMPPVSTTSLATAGAWAGRTPFAIDLSSCDPDTGRVSAYFEPGPTVNLSTGRLIVDTGTDAATNVEIGLLNNDFSAIAAGAASQNSQVVDINSGSATLNYYSQYVSLGNATAGMANSRVQYTLTYQ